MKHVSAFIIAYKNLPAAQWKNSLYYHEYRDRRQYS